MDIVVEFPDYPPIPKSEMFKRLARQHEIEIEAGAEWCEQRIVWQKGKVVRYEKLERFL
jgi:hypothetical protein